MPIASAIYVCPCGAMASLVPSRRKFCPPCAKVRRNKAAAASKVRAAQGIRTNRSNVNTARLRTSGWIMDWLKAHPCTCGEAHPVFLEFMGRPDHVGPTPETLRSQGRPLVEVQAAALTCAVRCVRCRAIWETFEAKSRFAYRVRFMDFPSVTYYPPSRDVPPERPKTGKLGGDAVTQPQVPPPRPAGLPSHGVRR